MRRPVSVRISSLFSVTPASRLAQSPAQDCRAIEDFLGVKAQDRSALDLEKAARGFRDEHGAASSSEEQDAVLQVAENLIEILLQCREHLFDIAHALADLLDLGGDTLCGMSCLGGASAFGSFAGGGPVVELHADLFHRPQRQVAQQQSRRAGLCPGEAGQRERLAKPWRIGLAQQRGASTHVDGGEGLAVALERHHHIEDLWRTEDLR